MTSGPDTDGTISGDSSGSANASGSASRRTTPARAQRGIEALGHPYVSGTIIGTIGASVFVLSNRGLLPPPWPLVSLILYVVVLAWYVWAVFLKPRVLPEPKFRPKAGLIYLASVIGMIALIQLGRLALEGLGRPDLGPAMIAVLVGLHFLPFAYAFRAPTFAILGWGMTIIGGLGLVVGALAGTWAAATAAVLTGLFMLVTMGADAQRGGERTPS